MSRPKRGTSTVVFDETLEGTYCSLQKAENLKRSKTSKTLSRNERNVQVECEETNRDIVLVKDTTTASFLDAEKEGTTLLVETHSSHSTSVETRQEFTVPVQNQQNISDETMTIISYGEGVLNGKNVLHVDKDSLMKFIARNKNPHECANTLYCGLVGSAVPIHYGAHWKCHPTLHLNTIPGKRPQKKCVMSHNDNNVCKNQFATRVCLKCSTESNVVYICSEQSNQKAKIKAPMYCQVLHANSFSTA